jgi:hypothetical protein
MLSGIKPRRFSWCTGASFFIDANLVFAEAVYQPDIETSERTGFQSGICGILKIMQTYADYYFHLIRQNMYENRVQRPKKKKTAGAEEDAKDAVEDEPPMLKLPIEYSIKTYEPKLELYKVIRIFFQLVF